MTQPPRSPAPLPERFALAIRILRAAAEAEMKTACGGCSLVEIVDEAAYDRHSELLQASNVLVEAPETADLLRGIARRFEGTTDE